MHAAPTAERAAGALRGLAAQPRLASGSSVRRMPQLIETPSRVEAAGTKPKLIDEYAGRVNTGDERVSVAHMRSPAGWVEPGQRPDFDEYTVVLAGTLHVEHEGGALDVRAGQAILVRGGEWVRYSTPDRRGPSTSRSACPRSRWTRSTATRTELASSAPPRRRDGARSGREPSKSSGQPSASASAAHRVLDVAGPRRATGRAAPPGSARRRARPATWRSPSSRRRCRCSSSARGPRS